MNLLLSEANMLSYFLIYVIDKNCWRKVDFNAEIFSKKFCGDLSMWFLYSVRYEYIIKQPFPLK